MATNGEACADVQRERELIGDIVAVLERLFPWGAPELSGRSPHADATPQAELTVRTPAGRLTFPVDIKAELTPRAVEYLAASGASHDPQPRKQRNTRGLSGTRAIGIVWAVTTLHPPFRMSDLIDAVGGGTSTPPTSPGSCAGWPKKASSKDPREVPSRMSISPA